MSKKKINASEALKSAREFLGNDKECTPKVREVFTPILDVLELLLENGLKNSSNSGIPPSQDPHRKKSGKGGKGSGRKAGGQPGHTGSHLPFFQSPDEIIHVKVEISKLPEGHTYKAAGHERRQVIDIKISRHVKEYQLEIVEDENGKKYTAQAPEGVNASIQYGDSIKSESVYLSNFQMIPYNRIADYFKDRLGISISQGTLHKFNESAYTLLAPFERAAKVNLRVADLAHADETSANVCGKNHWIHSASNQDWALYKIDNRSKDAMDRAGILPHFKGVLVHDNLNTYYMYKQCAHALCNAHHLRELELAETTRPEQTWAPQMQAFLKELNVEVIAAGGALNPAEQAIQLERYMEVIALGDKECPLAVRLPHELKKRGRLAQTKERNLLDRLKSRHSDTLRFMTDSKVPFTNNRAEQDLRMVKVKQKNSGCFRSEEGSRFFCRNRSYILTCRRRGITATKGLGMLFSNKLPDFCKKGIEARRPAMVVPATPGAVWLHANFGAPVMNALAGNDQVLQNLISHRHAEYECASAFTSTG